MSRTELHFGKLRKVELNTDLETFYKEKLKEIGITELRTYDNDWEDAFKCELGETYYVVKGQLWEVFEHKEEEDDEDIYKLTPNPDGTYSFIMKFYNGGTCLSECIEEELEKL